jgi:putative transport protein
MDGFIKLLHDKPELPLFLTLVAGQFLGRIKIKEFGFGSVVGTLIAGIIIGIAVKPVYPDMVRWSFFYLFLFGIGYGVGPQFFSSLRKDSLPLVALAAVIDVSGLLAVLGMSALFGFDEGTAVGLLSGGMTQSAALGTGISALNALPIDEVAKNTLTANAPLADAICYGFGDIGLILWLVVFGPWLMKIDFRQECTALAAKMAGMAEGTKALLTPPQFSFRAYRIEAAGLAGRTLEKLEKQFAAERLAIQRVLRNGRELEMRPSLALAPGDTVVISARSSLFTDAERRIGPEVTDPEVLSVSLASAAVVVKSKTVAGHSIGELAANPEIREAGRGVFLQSLQRGAAPLPLIPGTVVEAGDIMRLIGSSGDVERAIRLIGFREYDPEKTSIALVGTGIALGILLGFLAIKVGGVPLGLGTSGSILVVGLVAGWLRAKTPIFGAVPEPARRLLTDIGLAVFIAIIGLNAGPRAVAALHESGVSFFAKVFFAGVLVTLAAPLIGTIFGHWFMKMNPVLILSGIAGGRSCTPGLNALREVGGSDVASLGYPVTYAIGNVLLTICGPIVVAIVHAWRH